MNDWLEIRFANLMHETAIEFSFFEHPAWIEIFKELRPVYNQPTYSFIGVHYMMRNKKKR